MIDASDITIVSTDVLIEELKSRHPQGAIIALQHPEHECRSSGKDWRISFKGEKLITLKLANIALWMHQQDLMQGSQGEDYEDITP